MLKHFPIQNYMTIEDVQPMDSYYRRPRIIKGRLTQMVRKVLGVIDDNHAIAPSKHSIPNFSSIRKKTYHIP